MRLFIVLVAAFVAAGSVEAAPRSSNAAADAFLRGVEQCSFQFFGIQLGQPFGAPRGLRGFAPAPEEADAPGVRSLSVNFPDATILKAKLPKGATGAVYVLIGSNGRLPMCQTLAVDAPNAGEAALRWFEKGEDAFQPRGGEERQFGLVQRLYARTFNGRDIAVGATLTLVEGAPLGSMTALSTMTLARED